MGVCASMLQPLTRASQILARMELLALRMVDVFGALVPLITKDRRAIVGIARLVFSIGLKCESAHLHANA